MTLHGESSYQIEQNYDSTYDVRLTTYSQRGTLFCVSQRRLMLITNVDKKMDSMIRTMLKQ